MHDVEVVKVEDTDEPRLDPEGAIIEVAACGICGTDARTFFNGDPRAPAPWALGHEPVGIVVEVGEGARLPAGVEKGARVFLGSILTCGECAWCADGLANLCEREELYGYTPHPGAYAEYAAVPPIATKNLIPLPRELPSDLATVADPFACALNGAEMLDIRYGDTVTIIGAGPIGCWQSVLARDRGAGRVYLTEVSKERLEIALTAVGEFVDDAWVAGADNGVEELLSRTGGAGADRVIVAAPSKQAQQAALVMAAKRARIVYFAGVTGPYVAGCDVGSQGTSAALYAADGTLVASAYEGYDLAFPHPGWAEQDPTAWTTAVIDTVGKLVQEVPEGR